MLCSFILVTPPITLCIHSFIRKHAIFFFQLNWLAGIYLIESYTQGLYHSLRKLKVTFKEDMKAVVAAAEAAASSSDEEQVVVSR